MLAPNAIHVDLPDAQGAYLSNVAYRDGALYLQVAIPVGDSGECMLSVFAESQLTGTSFARNGDSFSYLYTDAEGTRLQIFETQQDSSAEPAAEPVAIEPAADSPEAR